MYRINNQDLVRSFKLAKDDLPISSWKQFAQKFLLFAVFIVAPPCNLFETAGKYTDCNLIKHIVSRTHWDLSMISLKLQTHLQCDLIIYVLARAYAEKSLPLKRQTKIAAVDILIFYFYVSKKIRLDFSHESSA